MGHTANSGQGHGHLLHCGVRPDCHPGCQPAGMGHEAAPQGTQEAGHGELGVGGMRQRLKVRRSQAMVSWGWGCGVGVGG